ncbi:MAG: type II toxin-antitoxin system VapC family toxin, partial [Saprospiraceae bacterium]
MKVMCDTNILIHAFNDNEKVVTELEKIGFDNIVLSSITVMELYQGMGNKNELQWMKSKLKYYDVIEFDERVSKLAKELIEKFSLSHGLQIPDAIIAATAVTYDIEVHTYNTKDF